MPRVFPGFLPVCAEVRAIVAPSGGFGFVVRWLFGLWLPDSGRGHRAGGAALHRRAAPPARRPRPAWWWGDCCRGSWGRNGRRGRKRRRRAHPDFLLSPLGRGGVRGCATVDSVRCRACCAAPIPAFPQRGKEKDRSVARALKGYSPQCEADVETPCGPGAGVGDLRGGEKRSGAGVPTLSIPLESPFGAPFTPGIKVPYPPSPF